MKRLLAFASILVVASAFLTVWADVTGRTTDWAQWHGNDRTNISKESGLQKSWSSSGPGLTWSIQGLGAGYGSLAIKDDRIFVQGTKDSRSVLHCLNRADGKTVWTVGLGPRLDQDRGGGPRGTPTVDGDRVYALSGGAPRPSCLGPAA